MTLISEYRTRATPAYGTVEIADADADVTDTEALEAARAQVVAGNGYQLYLHSLQHDIDVEIVIRVWESPFPQPAEAEGAALITLESKVGVLLVKQFTYGLAGQLNLPQPGVYEGHVTWSERQETAAYYNTCLRRSVEENWDADQIGEAWKNSPVRDKYEINLWHVRESDVDDYD
ncbi:hypothetical protein IHE55_28460 [Streptomyces pactum]|uniref:Uncharacterized protein n=1 Tax=Streptomyces pactum TaxID=68249 RepID=A0ABS0NTG3_9ACTN|nr:hypothetical protein [Streptomyces pactum]MBH5338502.1 hypothetical protein [Streptomyces pactum]